MSNCLAVSKKYWLHKVIHRLCSLQPFSILFSKDRRAFEVETVGGCSFLLGLATRQSEREKRKKGDRKLSILQVSRKGDSGGTQTSVNLLNFLPEYKEYRRLGSLGINLDLH